MIDQITRHQIYLQRLGSQLANSFDPYLIETDKLIREILSRGEMETVGQYKSVMSEVRKAVIGQYTAYTEEVTGELEELAEYESSWVADLLKSITTGLAIATAGKLAWQWSRTRPVTMSGNQAYLLDDLLSTFAKNNTDRVLAVIRNGFYQGLTSADMIKQIRGTKANQFKDGILNTTRRYASAIVRTASNHVTNQSKQATAKANQDIVKGWMFVATLDRNTTEKCRHYDQLGEVYEIGKGPVPPLHTGCRSVQTFELHNKTGILEFSTKGTRASSGANGGQQVADMPYYDWLATQPKWFQQEVLGKAKTELFRNGGLSTDEFAKLTSNNFGEPLTLAQIKQKDAQAWSNAGLE